MRDQRTGDTALVVVVLVLSKWGIIQMGPATTDENVRIRITRMVPFVFPFDTRFRISSVIGEKQN